MGFLEFIFAAIGLSLLATISHNIAVIGRLLEEAKRQRESEARHMRWPK